MTASLLPLPAAEPNWLPGGNMPDFSWAGYHHGEAEPPNVPRGISVKDFGAKGDGVTDDSAAFLQAIEQATGAVEIPAGRYVIKQILEIRKPGIVLRGEGPQKSILTFPVPLTDVREDWGATTSGERTSNYSWSGGFIWFKGDLRAKTVTKITAEAKRGDTVLQVGGTSKLAVGQEVMVQVKDTPENSLATHLYSGDPGPVEKLKGGIHARLVTRVTALDAQARTVTLARPLRFDIRLDWQPVVKTIDPSVTESGIESLGFEFPPTPYGGHFKELGQNPLAFNGVIHCWARDLEFVNADSGIFAGSTFCTFRRVTLRSERPVDSKDYTGHHGIYLGGDDNVYAEFDHQVKFYHDLSLSHCAGNVLENGRGLDLSLDHHKRAPYANLYTNLDAGEGTRLWMSGGGDALGKHCAGLGTFWNIRAERAIPAPPERFDPGSLNIVGVGGDAKVTPANLHEAQLQRRLGK
jgi:hypothetical protein